jgi:hypothetical protein
VKIVQTFPFYAKFLAKNPLNLAVFEEKNCANNSNFCKTAYFFKLRRAFALASSLQFEWFYSDKIASSLQNH